MRKHPFLIFFLLLGQQALPAFAEDDYALTCKDCVTNDRDLRGTELVCYCSTFGSASVQQTSLWIVENSTSTRCVPGTIHNLNGTLICTTEPMARAPVPPPEPPPTACKDPYGTAGVANCNPDPVIPPPLASQLILPPDIAQLGPPVIDPTVLPPPVPVKVDTSRADKWVARIHNSALFEQPVGSAQQVNAHATGASKIFIQQNEAYSAHTNVLFRCAETSLGGRTDADCATFPNDPECAGVLKSLENATTCNTPAPPGSPAGAPCLTYGRYGYAMEEWLVFGQQFYNGMSTCITTRDAPNGDAPRQARMLNLTDMASLAMVGSGGVNGPKDSSTVTGKVNKQIDPGSLNVQVKEISAKHDDGSSHLGYEKGEVLLQSAKGTPFTKVFGESPFAEKLGSQSKELVIGSLEDPKEVIGRVNEKKLAMKDKNGESVAGSKSTTGGKDMMAELEKVAGDNSAINVKLPQGSGPGGKKSVERFEAMLAAANSELKKREKGALAPEAMATAEPLPSSVDRPSHAQDGRAPASLVSEVDQSLFERVRVSYRRYAPKMRESKTARDVRHTDSPAFFRDL